MSDNPSSDRAEQVQSVFAEAVELHGESRTGLLDRLCGNDAELRKEVESLLLAFEEHSDTVRNLFRELPLADPIQTYPGPAADPQATIGLTGRQFGRYRILEKLGGGGMGVVYLAHDSQLDRTVALKFLPQHLHADEDAKSRFRQEAQAASALDNANICTIHDIGETDEGRLYIAMAAYRGETLKKKVERGALTLEEILDFGMQAARGLAKAHSAGIVHRDIKPANLFVTDDGVVKLLDFGIAKISGVNLTRSGATMGTVAYMSPEQIRGERVDHRTDIWSLGAVLFELATGSHPFYGDSDPALIYSVLNTDPDSSLIEDPGLVAVIEACLAKEPDNRITSADDLEIALSALSDGLGFDTRTLPKRRRRPTALTIAGGVVALALLVTSGWFLSTLLWPDDQGSGERQMLLILPFENHGKPDDQYFADGMAEELSVRLSSLESIGIISRNTANRYRATNKTTAEIGEELGVDYVVGGTLRWDEYPDGSRRVRIAPYLTRVSDDRQLWAESYDRRLEDILDVQKDVAVQVASNLETKLEPGQMQQLQATLTSSSDAYQEYLKGLAAFRTVNLDSAQTVVAIEHFQKALGFDSTFADAAYMLTQASGKIVFDEYWKIDRPAPQHWIEVSREAAGLASRQAPGTRSDLLANGYYRLYVTHDYAGALNLFDRALESTEDVDVYAALGLANRRMGALQAAYDYFQKALSLDPQDVVLLQQAQNAAYYLRRFRKVLELYDRRAAIDSTQFSYCARALILLQVDLNTERARKLLDSSPTPIKHCHRIDFFDRRFRYLADHYESGEWDPNAGNEEVFIAEAYRQLGLREKEIEVWNLMWFAPGFINTNGFLAIKEAGLANADSALALLEAHRRWLSRERGVTLTAYNAFAAFVYAFLGMDDELFNLLEAEVSGPGWMNRAFLLRPTFDHVRDNPRFKAVMERMASWETRDD